MDAISNVIGYIIAILISIIGFFLRQYAKAVEKNAIAVEENNKILAQVLTQLAVATTEREHLKERIEHLEKDKVNKDAFELVAKEIHEIKEMFKNLP